MARLQTRQLSNPDEVRRFPNGMIEVFELDDMIIGRTVFEPGWHWKTDVAPLAGTASCQYHHLGVCLSGRLGVRMDDGTTLEVAGGTVFDIPPGHDGWVIGDEPWVTYDVAGMRGFGRELGGGESVLASILFTDVVDSTATAERLGDRAWRDLIARLNERCQVELDRHRGRLIKTTGDGILAMFDGAERAVRCADAIVRGATSLGLAVRAGVHTGEVELVAGDVRGLVVHIASRVMALAGPGEVFVSGTTYALLSDGQLAFEDRGQHELKGITGARRVWSLAESATRA